MKVILITEARSAHLNIYLRFYFSSNQLLGFSPDTLVTSTNQTDRHNITEILLKVALNTITLTLTSNRLRSLSTLTQYIKIESIHEEGFSRYASCGNNLYIYVFITITRSISLLMDYQTPGYHPPMASSQCFDTDFVIQIYLYLKYTVKK